MTERLQVYKCAVCGNIIEVLYPGAGKLVCCGQPMQILEAGVSDGAVEKHVPFIEKTANGFLVKVGTAAHPMIETHYIEWIELIADNGIVYRKFLEPDDKPEAVFEDVAGKHVTVRAYCNLHGLWKAEFTD